MLWKLRNCRCFLFFCCWKASYLRWNGYLDHITYYTKGNRRHKDGQRISAIVDMTSNPRKVVFYVDDIEQPNFVIGIPSEIRFWV
ncbi:MAG: hypothetical protein EZS28_051196, partial [Streblomastix strix]